MFRHAERGSDHRYLFSSNEVKKAYHLVMRYIPFLVHKLGDQGSWDDFLVLLGEVGISF